MTQYTKPTVLPAWAESAGGADVLQPSNAEIQAGWPLSNVPPSRKRFNWVLKYLAQGVRYLLQRGIPEWDAAEDYRINDRVMGSDGKTYKCIQAGVNKDPTTQTAYWTRWGFTLAELNAEATTPAQFDNSTKLATTAFIQAAVGSMSGTSSVSANATLTALHVGRIVNMAAGGPYTITLPLVSALPEGSAIFFQNTSGVTQSVSRQGTDTITTNGNALTSLSIQPGESALFIKYGTYWYATGSATLGTVGGFGSSIAGNGYQKLPSGLIIQWGTGSFSANSTTTVSLPIAFPNAFVGVVTTVRDNAATNTAYPFGAALPLNLSSFSMRAYYTASSITHTWIAIGY